MDFKIPWRLGRYCQSGYPNYPIYFRFRRNRWESWDQFLRESRNIYEEGDDARGEQIPGTLPKVPTGISTIEGIYSVTPFSVTSFQSKVGTKH